MDNILRLFQQGGEPKRSFVDEPVNLWQQLYNNGITELSYEDYKKKSFEAQREDFKKLADKINGPAQKKIDSLISAGGFLSEVIERPIFVENVLSDTTTEVSPKIVENSGKKYVVKKRNTTKPKTEAAKSEDTKTKVNNTVTNGYLADVIKMQKGGRIDPILSQLLDHLERKKNNPLAPIPDIEIEDTRKVRGTTGKPINPNKDLLTGRYPQEYIDRIIDASQELGVDPNIALAVALQESRLGKTTEGNIGHIVYKDPSLGITGDDEVYDFITLLKYKMEDYADKLKIPKNDKALRIQAYNGYGKLRPETEQDYHGFKAKSFYGVEIPKEGLDMKKNPLYGKQILDLADNIIKKNKYIQQRIKESDFYQYGGMVNTTGYKDGTATAKNPYNIIPSGNITMKGVSQPVMAFPQNGAPVLMMPDKDYKFDDSDFVLEVPLYALGGYLQNLQQGGQVPVEQMQQPQQEQQIDPNQEMITGVIEMLRMVVDKKNRQEIALKKLEELLAEGIPVNQEGFMEAVMGEDTQEDIQRMKEGGFPERYKKLGFSKVDTPKKTPSHPTKSHAVVVKIDGKYKILRFGQQGVKGSPKREGESKADAARRKSFKARHAKNIKKGKSSAAFWASETKW